MPAVDPSVVGDESAWWQTGGADRHTRSIEALVLPHFCAALAFRDRLSKQVLNAVEPADDMFMLNNVYMLRSYTDPAWQGTTPPLEDYEAQGFRRAGADRWRSHAVPPHMARHYADLGLSPIDAQVWAVIPNLVEAYLTVGVDHHDVHDLVRRGVMPHDVRRTEDMREQSLGGEGSTCGHGLLSNREQGVEADEADVEWIDAFEGPDPWAIETAHSAPDSDGTVCSVVPIHARRRMDEPPF